MGTIIKDAQLLTMHPTDRGVAIAADLRIEGKRIAAIGPDLTRQPGDTILDGRDRLVMPGLVNAHVHSWEAMFKGRYDNMPLELWMLLSYPVLGLEPLPADLIRLRTLLVGIESLKAGVTCVLDDVIEMPNQSIDALEAVFRGYGEVGIRANVSGNIMDRYMTDTLPFAKGDLPEELLAKERMSPRPTVSEYLDFSRQAIARFHDTTGRLRYVIAPSGPQRCTPELLVAAAELAEQHDVAYHIHVLETKVQAVTGKEFYGRTLVRYLDDLEVLSERSTLAHGIWLTKDDIDRLGQHGSSVAHNAISNQKLGAGIAPFRQLLDAGVNVALGTDGLSSNDTARMFDVMKAAALLHKVTSPDYERWPTAPEILHAATLAGARSAVIDEHTGSLAPGKQADLLIINLNTINFTPLNDVRNHLVYCENGESIETVFVAGEIVVADGRPTRVDEAALLGELRACAPAFLERHRQIEDANRVFAGAFGRVHYRCSGQEIGINRYSSDESTWLGSSPGDPLSNL